MKRVLLTALVTGLLCGCTDNDKSTVPMETKSIESSKPVTLVSWNIREVFSEDIASERLDDISALQSKLESDIIVLQEFTNCDQLPIIAKGLGYDEPSYSCSDFNENNNNKWGSFELGVVSSYPITKSIEYEFKPDQATNGTATEVDVPDTSDIAGLDQSKTSSRGYLWTEIGDLNLAIVNVHLKSSRGDVGTDDKKNAQKRELVAASIYKSIKEHKKSNDGFTYIVAGDFNVGHSDSKKNGQDLTNDCYDNCSDKDLYDETHYIFTELTGMTNVMLSVKDSTFPRYPGSPIDNIYVSAPEKFNKGASGDSAFGSDHKPVYVTFTP